MKANVPEKIYISDYGSEVRYNWHPERLAVKDIEYIRTDAFIEKAQEYIYKQLNEGCIECGDIERFVENMKIYMKGGEV